MTGQKDTIHNILLSNYPVENVSTFCADFAHWLGFYNNNKRLIKHALFIPRVNSFGNTNWFCKQPFEKMKKKSKKKKKKKKKFFFFFFFFLGAKADPGYKRTRVITRRVLTGLTCIHNFMIPPPTPPLPQHPHSSQLTPFPSFYLHLLENKI